MTGVIYERGLYYAYAPLLTAHPMGGGRHDGMTLGDLRLLFRLSNDTHPRRGHIVIRKGLAAPAAYLRSGCKSCQWTTADSAKPTLPAAEALDFVYLDAPEAWPALARQAVEQLSDGGALVIRGIHRKAADRAADQCQRQEQDDAACKQQADDQHRHGDRKQKRSQYLRRSPGERQSKPYGFEGKPAKQDDYQQFKHFIYPFQKQKSRLSLSKCESRAVQNTQGSFLVSP